MKNKTTGIKKRSTEKVTSQNLGNYTIIPAPKQSGSQNIYFRSFIPIENKIQSYKIINLGVKFIAVMPITFVMRYEY